MRHIDWWLWVDAAQLMPTFPNDAVPRFPRMAVAASVVGSVADSVAALGHAMTCFSEAPRGP